jgi:hypothetical protein
LLILVREVLFFIMTWIYSYVTVVTTHQYSSSLPLVRNNFFSTWHFVANYTQTQIGGKTELFSSVTYTQTVQHRLSGGKTKRRAVDACRCWRGGNACGFAIEKVGTRVNGPPCIENVIRKVPSKTVALHVSESVSVGTPILRSIPVDVHLVSLTQRHFTCTLTMLTLHALCQDYIISSLRTSGILRDIRKLFFNRFVNVMHAVEILMTPSLLNYLLKCYCFHL